MDRNYMAGSQFLTLKPNFSVQSKQKKMRSEQYPYEVNVLMKLSFYNDNINFTNHQMIIL